MSVIQKNPLSRRDYRSVRTVILANGKYPSHAVPVRYLEEADLIVCCDGAAEKLVSHGMDPGIITGDLDSVSPELKRRYKSILVYDGDQETNDLTKAIKWCVSHGIKEIAILGATGIREDHTLGNISLLADYNRDIKAIMLTDTGSFQVFDPTVTIDSFPGQQVSLFSLDPNMAVTSHGLRYPLINLRLTSWWRGTLNEALGDSFTLTFEGGELIVYMEY
jgi:thiamine pyrophosphokinase